MLKKAVLKRLLTAFLVFVCIMAVLGCGKRSAGEGAGNKEEEDVQESTELTQRQKELLEEMGLPADYGELTDTQKNAVTSVEALITYLEDKYHEKFCDLSYAEAGRLEEERLEA